MAKMSIKLISTFSWKDWKYHLTIFNIYHSRAHSEFTITRCDQLDKWSPPPLLCLAESDLFRSSPARTGTVFYLIYHWLWKPLFKIHLLNNNSWRYMITGIIENSTADIATIPLLFSHFITAKCMLNFLKAVSHIQQALIQTHSSSTSA